MVVPNFLSFPRDFLSNNYDFPSITNKGSLKNENIEPIDQYQS